MGKKKKKDIIHLEKESVIPILKHKLIAALANRISFGLFNSISHLFFFINAMHGCMDDGFQFGLVHSQNVADLMLMSS
jgi:hypothetical protein